jgi:hypothetical protein
MDHKGLWVTSHSPNQRIGVQLFLERATTRTITFFISRAHHDAVGSDIAVRLQCVSGLKPERLLRLD